MTIPQLIPMTGMVIALILTLVYNIVVNRRFALEARVRLKEIEAAERAQVRKEKGGRDPLDAQRSVWACWNRHPLQRRGVYGQRR